MENLPLDTITPEEEDALNQMYNERENEPSSDYYTPSIQRNESLVESLLDDDKKREFVPKIKENPISQENKEPEESDTSNEESTEEVKFATPKPQQTTEFKRPVINFFSPMSQRK